MFYYVIMCIYIVCNIKQYKQYKLQNFLKIYYGRILDGEKHWFRCTWAPMTWRLGVEVAGAHVVRPQQWLWKSLGDQDQYGSLWINIWITMDQCCHSSPWTHHVTSMRHYPTKHQISKCLLVLEPLRSLIRTFWWCPELGTRANAGSLSRWVLDPGSFRDLNLGLQQPV